MSGPRDGSSDLDRIDQEKRTLARALERREQMLRLLQEIQRGNSNLLGNLMREIEQEKEKSDGLLRNILPADVIERMGGGETTIADSVDCASVVFSDFKGFTAMSASMSARDLVTALNEIYSAFDSAAQRVGIEKIKTIGDAYLAASGLEDDGRDHAAIATEFALSIRDIVRETRLAGRSWQMRVGVHSGPLTAGVIGQHKFAYDIWGDTVNVASRVQDAAPANEVLVSTETAGLLDDDRFQLSDKAEVELKGKGLHGVFRVDWST